MSRRIVLFPNVLLLDKVVRDKSGTLVSGWAVNGGWEYRRATDERTSGHREVAVPDDIRGGYNEIIDWAEGQL